MMGSRKRKKCSTANPRSTYLDTPPDFTLLASLYPSFRPFLHFSNGRPRIDWTDFNATRELTRVLLLHSHGLHWWIPDPQLCPIVPNRSNYIHWIQHLLSFDLALVHTSHRHTVLGFDIGTGASCIYPLLGASLFGWSFVASDFTDVALEWADKNVRNNPHVSDLIEIRKVGACVNGADAPVVEDSDAHNLYKGPDVLRGVVMDGENFDFCMCNPPFFENIEEAWMNPKTSCGGTPEEMVCGGGELAFITRIIEDSVFLKYSFRWFTSMVGRKVNVKVLTQRIWGAGATVVKKTEFSQGQTHRWGLAWSFLSCPKIITSVGCADKSSLSFILEGVQRRYSALHVLQEMESFFSIYKAFCQSNLLSFNLDVSLPNGQLDSIMSNVDLSNGQESAICFQFPTSDLIFRISVFQQASGMLLIKGSLKERQTSTYGLFLMIFKQLEECLKSKFTSRHHQVTDKPLHD